MVSPTSPPKPAYPRRFVPLAGALAALLALPGAAAKAQQATIDLLRVGTSGTLAAEGDASKEKAALDTLRGFIKDETGLNDEIIRQKSWRELAEKMAKGKLHVGVFQGYEFAWAREKYPALEPLALAVNVYRYPVVYVVTRKDDPARDFAGLRGQSLSIPDTPARYLRLFVDRQCHLLGKKSDAFFAKVSSPKNIEEALDDVVDGTVKATVVDRAGLEAFKRRKPGRFKQLKPVAQSQPFPPAVVACHGNVLDDATRRRFRQGLLGASQKEKGQTMLTLFRLTGFDPVPDDFEKVLAATRKAYPPETATRASK
jgi:ABC-type phosphate/phosphonate transport system substrate-binding protein